MERFEPVDGVYNITANQKEDLLIQLRGDVEANNQSRKGIVTKAIIDGEENQLRNRGNVKNPSWNFATKTAKTRENIKRRTNLTYSPLGNEARAVQKKVFAGVALDAYSLGLGEIYEEHRTPVSQWNIFGDPEGGSDDPTNVVQRFVDDTKAAKDSMEGISERNAFKWATDIDDNDLLQVVNASEWDYNDHFQKGVNLNREEVNKFNQHLKGKKVDISPKLQEKFNYLEQELNGNGNGNGNGKVNGRVNGRVNGKKNGFSTLKKAGVGTALISSVSFLPSVEAAEQTQELIDNKEYKQAAITYGKDLIVGDVKGRAALKAFTSTSNFLARKGVSKIARRKLIQLVGRQLAKKGIALAAGPAAPMLLTALLIKDIYDVANVVSRGRLNQTVSNAFSNKNNTAEKAQSLNLNSI